MSAAAVTRLSAYAPWKELGECLLYSLDLLAFSVVQRCRCRDVDLDVDVDVERCKGYYQYDYMVNEDSVIAEWDVTEEGQDFLMRASSDGT